MRLRSTLAASGHPRHSALLVVPHGFFCARISLRSVLCVCVDLLSLCVLLSEQGIARHYSLVLEDAGSRFALLRIVLLFLVLPEPAKPYGYTF